MKFSANKIPDIVREAKYNKKNYEELNSLKKDRMKKIDIMQNKREANLLKAIQAKRKLNTKMEEFDAHQEMLNDKIITHENTIKKLAKKEHQRNRNPIGDSLAGPGKNYKKNAKHQITELEAKVQELEKKLFEIQEKKKEEKPNSDEDLDIEDETPQARDNHIPDVRINKKKKGAKNSILLKETLKTIKDKDEEIAALKELIRKSQMKVKLKDKEMFKLRMRLKKFNGIHATH